MENSIEKPNYLFSLFLEDKNVYNLSQAYWGRMIKSIAREGGLSFQPYLNPYDGAGQKEYGANPIYDAYFPTLQKAVRIIQDTPEEGASDITAWINDFEIEEDQPETPELVIAIALSQDSAGMARELLRKWLLDGLSGKEMEKVFEGVVKQ